LRTDPRGRKCQKEGDEILSNEPFSFGPVAAEYAALGLPVFQLQIQGKKAAVEGWQEAATTDPAVALKLWEGETNRLFNIGVAMGGGIVAIDLDKPKADGEPDGEDSLMEYAAQHGGEIPPTWTFQTGRGGKQLLFRTDATIGNFVKILPNVDVRGKGGYSMFPPSIHPNGNPYQWLEGQNPSAMPDGPADLPGFLLELLTEEKTTGASFELPDKIPKGERNSTLFKMASSLRAQAYTEPEILATLTAVNAGRCDPPLPDKELETICGSVGKYERGSGISKKVSKSKLSLIPMSSVEARKAEYLIPPYLPRGMITVIGGISGSAKTWLALSMASSVTTGERLPFLTPYDAPPRPGYVYYFTNENDPNCVIRPRLDLMKPDLSKILIRGMGESIYDPLTLNDPRLNDLALEYPPALIIFDPIQSYLGAGVEMNKANEIRPITDWLGNFTKQHDCSTVLISHMSKPGVGIATALDRLLGSSDIRNVARSIIIVGNDPDNPDSRIFAHAKNSLGIPGCSQRFHIENGLGVVYDGECDLTADDIIKQSEGKRKKAAVTLTAAVNHLNELLYGDGVATLEQVERLQETMGVSRGTLYTAKKELAIQSISIGQPPNRKTWWVLPTVDIGKFKAEQERLEKGE